MASLTNLTQISMPLGLVSGGFSGIFGNNDYSGIIKLMNLQMEALKIINDKMDLIYGQINLVYESLENIKEEIENLPDKTASKTFANQLIGTINNFQNEVIAYRKQKEDGVVDEAYYLDSFKRSSNEIRDRAASLLGLGNFYNMPLISTCIFFEVLAAALIQRPKQSVNESLLKYGIWLSKCQMELEKLISNERKDWLQTFTEAEKIHLIGRCHNKFDFEQYLKDGEYFPKDIQHFYITYTRCKLILSHTDIADDLNSIKGLIEENFLISNELPAEFKVVEEAIPEDRQINYQFNAEDQTVLSVKLNDGTVLQEVLGTLHSLSSCTFDPEGKKRLQELPEVMRLSKDISRESNNILAYASLQKVASDTVSFITKIISEEKLETEKILQSVDLAQISQNKAKQWVAFLDKEHQAIEDSLQAERLKEIKEKMILLQSSATATYEQYSQLERELLDNLSQDLLAKFLELLEPVGKEIEKTIQNIGKEAEILAQNIGKNLEKAAQDTTEELNKASQNVGDLFSASADFVWNQCKAYEKVINDASKRIESGKIVDAVWHIAFDPIKNSEDNFFEATTKSSLLNGIATAAATVYGGPAGAAAYASWYTYKVTKDLSLALKNGLIAGLTSFGLSEVNKFSGDTISDLAKRTLATAAIGAASIAASGGTEKDIIEGFLKGAALTLARDVYKNTTNTEIEGKAPTEEGVSKLHGNTYRRFVTFYDDQGNPVAPEKIGGITRLMPKSFSHVGFETAVDDTWGLGTETSFPMEYLAKVPYINDMAYFHDIWMDNTGLTGLSLGMTIIPATFLTVLGSDTPIILDIINK
ncbi:hypothetical protein ACHRVW_09185 [Flavobacterium collinsii]|uniref:hypothetical protein n=1 Tax=Flavobacterium collinsii TaxID=1114861 RepID=UPI003756C163